MKTYSTPSNAKRAAMAANGGSLDGYTLHGGKGAYYYAKAQQDAKGHITEVIPVADHDRRSPAAVVLGNGLGTPVAAKAKKSAPVKKVAALEYERPAAKKPAAKKAQPYPLARTAAVDKVLGKKTAKKAAPAKKAAKKVARKAAPKAVQEYDVKNGPTQGRISGYHIDQDRDEKHGVKRRSAGTIGGRLWAIFDKLATKAGGPAKLEIATVKEHKDVADFNQNKVVIEFYYWRRYHGVRGRGKKQKVSA